MHRMRRYVMLTGLSLAALSTLSGRAAAGLIESNPQATFPDLYGYSIGKSLQSGSVRYAYDRATETGQFTMVNIPDLIATGHDPAGGLDEVKVFADPDGVRRQVLNVTLDKAGNLVAGGNNTYELHGTVIIPAVRDGAGTVLTDELTISGLLLKGTPTAFGSQDIPNSGLDTYDLEMDITGGELADYFGKDAYVEITTKLGSTFNGSFTEDFEGFKVTSNTKGTFVTPPPLPEGEVPEPTTLVLLVVGGAGLAYRHRRRLKA